MGCQEAVRKPPDGRFEPWIGTESLEARRIRCEGAFGVAERLVPAAGGTSGGGWGPRNARGRAAARTPARSWSGEPGSGPAGHAGALADSGHGRHATLESRAAPMHAELDPRPFLDHVPDAWLRRTQGRESFATGPLPGHAAGVIVKRTTGGPRGERWFDRLRVRRGASPGRVEYDNLVALADDGVPVPRAISWCDERARPGARRSLVVMERVVHRETLRDHLARASEPERRVALERLLAIVVNLHRHGWYHRDLYVQHVLVRAFDGAYVLIDVARARRARSPRARWFVKDLAAILHSLPESVGDRAGLRFVTAWLDAMGVRSRGARRRWVAAIARKRARMAAHVPRDERALGVGC